MLRFIVRGIDYTGTAHGASGPVPITYLTIDGDVVELERILRVRDGLVERQLVGVELLPERGGEGEE